MDKKNKSYLRIFIVTFAAGLVSSIVVRYLFSGKVETSTLQAIMTGSFVANVVLFVMCLIFKTRLKKNGLDKP
jgi:DMSO/TMAO reductase YedYZ heme-binding membrane subunit